MWYSGLDSRLHHLDGYGMLRCGTWLMVVNLTNKRCLVYTNWPPADSIFSYILIKGQIWVIVQQYINSHSITRPCPLPRRPTKIIQATNLSFIFGHSPSLTHDIYKASQHQQPHMQTNNTPSPNA